MSEYGGGLTFGQCCTMDKERIRHALYYHAKLFTGSRAMEQSAVFCFPCLNLFPQIKLCYRQKITAIRNVSPTAAETAGFVRYPATRYAGMPNNALAADTFINEKRKDG